MIVYLKGLIINLGVKDKLSYIDVAAASGIGYRVFVSSFSLEVKVGDEIKLYTSYQVREDSQTLFGFESESKRDFFELLTSVSGIGPKIGISLLMAYPIEDIQQFISSGNYKELSKVSGLGEKGAKKIIIELQPKLDIDLSRDQKEWESKNSVVVTEVRSALKVLGFSREEISEKLELAKSLIEQDAEGKLRSEDLLRIVLKSK